MASLEFSAFGKVLETAPLGWLLLALVSIATSSAFYTWVWYHPAGFKKLIAPADPCRVMAKLAHGLKFVQFYSIYRCTDFSHLSAMPAWQWVVFAVLVAAGQHLNMRVYQLLGEDGVYYGSRFGKSIPWVDAWPYNSLRDPQYLGCLLCLAGVAPVVPIEIITWWAANYFYLMALESKVPTASSGKKKA